MLSVRPTLIWDLPVRVVHLGLIAGVGAAWLTAGSDRLLAIHTFAGHAVFFLLLFRIAWGFVGSAHARWRTWLFPWRAVVEHARALRRGDAPRSVGHNPIASWVMLAGIALLLGVSLTGAVTLIGAEQQGPLRGLFTVDTGMRARVVHEVLAWGVLGFVAAHLAGVLKESLRVREALPVSMITGRKHAEGGAVRPFRGVGVALLLAGALGAFVYFQGWWWSTPERPWLPFTPVAMADDAEWREECGGCHLAFHPALLPARSWERMMDEQAAHFGDDLALDPEATARIRAFLVTHAAEADATEWAWQIARDVPAAEAPQRVTDLEWWEAEHADVPPEVWKHPDVAEGLRCDACHADAEPGSFEDGAMHIPADAPAATSQR